MKEEYFKKGKSKFRRIIEGIEKISLPEKSEGGVLEFSSEEKAEQLWALWNEYRRKKYEILIKERKKPRTERKKLEEIKELPELKRVMEKISELWKDTRVQILFKRHLEENLRERERVYPNLENYHQKERELEETKQEYENLLRSLFSCRGEEPEESTQLDLAELSTKIKVLKENLESVFVGNPELAAFVQYERIKIYHQQFEKDGFIWTPSREKLFDEILNHLVIVNKNRPLLLVGETGTGKTHLVRKAVERLTGRPPFEIGEEAKTDIRPILGSAWIEEGRTYINYGPLGQAITGKKSSLEEKSDGGGIFYMDEMNGYPPDALRSLIKQISGRLPGEEVTFAAWRGIREKIAEKAGLIGAANLPDEEKGRHLDRPPLPVELIRELTILEVDYPPLIETYEMMLAVLMDKNGRIRLKTGEIEPAWEEVVDPTIKEKTERLNSNPKSGGTLWRFARLVNEIQSSYKGNENILTPTKRDASYLDGAVLDLGIVLSWLREYRTSQLRGGIKLRQFLHDKLRKWIGEKTRSRRDQDLLKEFCTAFDLPIEGPDTNKSDVKGEKIWSEEEIGFLSPRVPRPKTKIEEPKPVFKTGVLEDGTIIEYKPVPQEEIDEKIWVGVTSDGRIVLKNKIMESIEVINQDEFEIIKREKDLSEIKTELKELLETSPEEFNRKIVEIIEEVVALVPSREQAAYRSKIMNDLKKLQPPKKIEYILNIFR